MRMIKDSWNVATCREYLRDLEGRRDADREQRESGRDEGDRKEHCVCGERVSDLSFNSYPLDLDLNDTSSFGVQLLCVATHR